MDLLSPINNIRNFNLNWKFCKGDVLGAQDPNFGYDNWQEVDLPHDWSIEGPFNPKWASCTGYLPGGVGWYRKKFIIPKSNEDKKVFIYFEGVYNNCEVWINGISLGKRPNGYISFYYEISEHLHFGGENVISVKVDHSKYADSRWYTGSGIYRNVKLIITNALYIKLWGVYAHASLSGLDHGLLEVNVTITNENSTAFEAKVINQLFYKGEIIGQTEQNITIAGNDESVIHGVIEVPDPKLWDLEYPELYNLISSIKVEDQILDQVETIVGFREIQFDPNKGFFLNGRSMKLKGICIHHDAGCLGAAVPVDVLSRRLDILKEMGCNAIRTSHNPFSPEFYDLCDKKGFLVIDEIFDEWELPKKKWIDGWNVGTPGMDGYAEHFKQWAKVDLRDQILRDRNHPCIIMWSIGNEIDFPNDPYSHEILNTEKNPQTWAKFDENLPHANRLGEIARELVSLVKKYDKTRPITAGLASALMSNEVGYADALDVVGYNYQEYRYKSDHVKYPERILYGSENSITLKAWQAVAENDFIMGQFLWTGIEYLGEAGKYPTRQSRHGLIDLAGYKKPEFYFRQSLWSEKSMVFMGISELNKDFKYSWEYEKIYPHWNWNPGQLVKVTVFSNCQEVELISNNKSFGTKQMEDFAENKLNWEIPFEPGELHAIARNNDKEVASFKLRTAGEPTQLLLKSDKRQIKVNNRDVAHIDLLIADEKGIPVYSANNNITCKVSGPIRLLGLEDANPTNIEDYNDSQQNAFKGRLLAYIQSFDQTGKGKIIFSSPGLSGAELQLDIV
jgi:beta-galactosidase/beta-glucuronidase